MNSMTTLATADRGRYLHPGHESSGSYAMYQIILVSRISMQTRVKFDVLPLVLHQRRAPVILGLSLFEDCHAGRILVGG